MGKDSENQLTLKNRLAYAGTDAAGNLLYCTLTSFINFFSYRCIWNIHRNSSNDSVDGKNFKYSNCSVMGDCN